MASLVSGSGVPVDGADNLEMELLRVECLRCGHRRSFTPGPWRYQEAGECPRCAYVGWADATELTEPTRRLFRDRPPERRVTFRPV